MHSFKRFYLKEIFEDVKRGDIHETNILDDGSIPVIGCGFENLGIEGWFDLSGQEIHKKAVTITGDGSYPLTTFYHEYKFGAKDNVTICVPKEEMSLPVIYYLVSVIDNERWRFSYGRKCYYNKMCEQKFPLPINDQGRIDIEYIEENIKVDFETVTPVKNEISPINPPKKLKEFILGADLKNLIAGKYHSISELDEGLVPLISCGEFNNGLIGVFDIPPKNQFFNTLTVAYNAKPLTTKFHSYKFGAKDDVAVLRNDDNLKHSTLIFIGAMLNKQTWRFSYGRKCFNDKLKTQSIYLPINDEGKIDEEYIKNLISNTPYWQHLSKFLMK